MITLKALNNNLRSVKITILIISVVLICYNVLRILNVPMTHDEICQASQLPTYHDIITLNPVTANTHILHYIIRKFFMETFHNTAPFVIRLDNLLALILFLYVIWLLLCKVFSKPFWILCGFLYIVLNPFMFEFWGLSRGYGLALACMVTSIYYIIMFLQQGRQKYIWLAQLWAILAVYSNFTLLNYFLSLQATIIIIPLLFDKVKITAVTKALPAVLLSVIVLYLLVAGPIRALRQHNELYYGGDTDLIHDTLKSLTDCSFMINYKSQFVSILDAAVVVVITLICLYWVISLFKHAYSEQAKAGVAFWLLFIIPIVGIYVQHQLLDVKYLIDRTALFLIVLFKLQVLYTIYYLSQKRPAILTSILGLLACICLINFPRLLNINRSWIWWGDTDNLNVLNKIVAENKNNPHKVTIRTYWIFTPSFIYYSDTKYKDKIVPVQYIAGEDITDDTSYNYYYIRAEQKASLLKDYTVDTAFSQGSVLMKRKW